MSTALISMCKDEADVAEAFLRHSAWHVDELIVADNLSEDGTREILDGLLDELPLVVFEDDEPGHYQGQKMTALAMKALARGHRWALAADFDELWYAPEGRRIADWLDAVGRETQFVKAAIFNHVCSALDPEEANPFLRIVFKQRAPLDTRWGKVACRLRPDLEIGEGNHSARTQGVGTTGYGLELRHFPYRSAEHFVAKAVKGLAALRAADLDEGTGAHWRAYGEAIEAGGPEAGAAWFYDAFFATDPEADDSLIYDPVTSILRGCP